MARMDNSAGCGMQGMAWHTACSVGSELGMRPQAKFVEARHRECEFYLEWRGDSCE